MKTKSAYWACQIGGRGIYTAMGMFMAAAQVGWVFPIVAGYLLFFLYSVALTDVLRKEIRRRNWLGESYGLLRVLGAAPVVAAVQVFLIFAVDLALRAGSSLFLQRPLYVFTTWIGLTGANCIWILFYVTLTSSRRFREKQVHLELSLREAELRALEAQLNPHFLFNCLNSVRALVSENPAQAQQMITSLANILRANLHRDLNHKVTLASEMELASAHPPLPERIGTPVGPRHVLPRRTQRNLEFEVGGQDISPSGGLAVTLRGGRAVEMSKRQSARLREILSL